MIAASVVLAPTHARSAEPNRDGMLEGVRRFLEVPPHIETVEPLTISTYADLDAIAAHGAWGCDPDDEGGCVRTFGRASLGGDVEELRLVGVEDDDTCVWRLLVKVPEGWLPDLMLGVSPTGCRAPTATGEPEWPEWRWFPISFTQIDSVVRIEGQRVSEGKVARSVVLCRVVPGGLGCSEQHAATRLTPNGRVLPPKPSMFPVSAAAEIGVRHPATWFARPTRGGPPPVPGAAYGGDETSRVWRVPLGPAGPDVVVIDARIPLVLLERAGRSVVLDELMFDYEHEETTVLAVDALAAFGVVRVSLEVRNAGPATVSWRKDVVVRLVPGGGGRIQVVYVATGVHMDTPSGSLGWARDVVVTPIGLRLVERDGPLAWFRSVGEIAWADLATTFLRDRRAMVRALRDVDPPKLAPWRRPPVDDVDPSGSPGRHGPMQGPLAVVPGYVEPRRHAFFDTTIEL